VVPGAFLLAGGSAVEVSSWGAKWTRRGPEAVWPAAALGLPFVTALLGVTVAQLFVFIVGVSLGGRQGWIRATKKANHI
jgi:hypothetical protein